ncbi:MAG: hypothetical protein HY811_04615 [Planctomycetes bacterium]|nr:hypothetical protein [Planctomycetota bacterium]
MYCPVCTYPNPPTTPKCGKCKSSLRTPEEAEEQQKLWDALPEPARLEFEEKCFLERRKYRKRRFFQLKNRLKQMVIGGILIGGLGFLHGKYITPDIITGCLIGFMLNRKRGGRFWGMALSGGAYFASYIYKGTHGLTYDKAGPFDDPELSLLVFVGLVVSVCAGYTWGFYLDRKYSDRLS